MVSGIMIRIYFVSALCNIFLNSLSLLVMRASQFPVEVIGSVSRESSARQQRGTSKDVSREIL